MTADDLKQDGSALRDRAALAVALHGAQITHGWGCGPDSTGCRQKHRMDADAILALLPAAALPPSAPPALDVERRSGNTLEREAHLRFEHPDCEWCQSVAATLAAEYARLQEQDRSEKVTGGAE